MARPNPNSRPHLYEVTNDADGVESPGDEYRGVGTVLRQARTRRQEDIGHVADELRIRRPYLEALEAGHYQDLPGPTYTVGFLRTYGEHLELDVDDLVERYKMEGQDPQASQALDFPTPTQEGQMPKAVVVVLALVLAASVYAGWQYFFDGGGRLADRVPEVPGNLLSKIEPTAPEPISPEPATTVYEPSQPVAETAAPSEPDAETAVGETVASQDVAASAPTQEASAARPTAEAPTTEAPSTEMQVAEPVVSEPITTEPAATEPPATESPATETAATAPVDTVVAAPASAGAGRVLITAKADSWVEIRDGNGAILLSEIMRAGDEFMLADDVEGAKLVTGNAGALTLIVDGVSLPSLGPVGAVRRDVSLAPQDLLADQDG